MISKQLILLLAALTVSSSVMADPILTTREEELLRQNIALIASNLPLHAMNIFIELFATRPDYQALFANFRDVPFDQLRNDPALQRHSVNILSKLASIVSENMHNKDALYAAFDEVAQHHVERYVNGEHAATLKAVVLRYLQAQLYDVLTADDLHDTLTAWDKVLIMAYNAFIAAN